MMECFRGGAGGCCDAMRVAGEMEKESGGIDAMRCQAGRDKPGVWARGSGHGIEGAFRRAVYNTAMAAPWLGRLEVRRSMILLRCYAGAD